MELDDLFRDWSFEIDATLAANEDGGLPHELFMMLFNELMLDAGETEEDITPVSYEERGRAAHGFSFSEHDGKLDIFITNYKRTEKPYTIYKNEVEASLKRVENFFSYFYQRKNHSVDLSDPTYDLVEILAKASITLLRVFLITDGSSTLSRSEDLEISGVAVQRHIWDAPRYLRNISSGKIDEDIEIITSEYGFNNVPCSSPVVDGNAGEIQTYLCVFPGEFIADIYQNFTSRLLERNVRAFLSFRTKFNRGILRTIEEEPEKFLAYNNGLTMTARSVQLNDEQTGLKGLSAIQIVNGGQTTNILYRAKYSEGLDLTKVSVPVKLCVLSDTAVEEFAPKIAEYANSQNVVRRTDITSNNPVYRELERCSRAIFAPALDGFHLETKWYFERARGQYADEQSRKSTAAQKKKFESEYPRKQKFDKGKLAQCWGVWYQEVEDVALGTEKYHPSFVENITSDKRKFDARDPEASFKRLVAMLILRDAVYKRVRERQYGYSYPGNVTDYTLALISNLSQMQINLANIWRKQSAPPELLDCVDYIAPIVGNTVRELCDNHGLIAREIAKGRKVAGKTLWQILKEKNLRLPVQIADFSEDEISAPNPEDPNPTPPPIDPKISQVIEMGAPQIWAMATWGRETENLQPWQRSILGSVAKRIEQDREPSLKQSIQVLKASSEAKKLGFKFDAQSI